MVSWSTKTRGRVQALGNLVSHAGTSAPIDWDLIIDGTRRLDVPSTWDSPKQLLEAALRQFQTDRWAGQRGRVEMWSEKDTAYTILAPVAEELQIPFQVNRGNKSTSFMHPAAVRCKEREQHTLILYVGDHDPSGVEMDADVKSRLHRYDAAHVTFRRVALTKEQIEQHQIPRR